MLKYQNKQKMRYKKPKSPLSNTKKKRKLCSKKLSYIEVVDIISTSHGCNNYVDNINSNPFELITIITFSIIGKYIMYI